MRVRLHCTAVVAAAALLASTSFAQTTPKYQPPGADTLSPRAVSESLSVLHMLDSTVRRQPRDFAAWYRLGMVAWALKTRDEVSSEFRQLDATKLGRIADTSLRIAKALAPDSTRYALMSARYLRESGFPVTRLASHYILDAAIEASRKSLSPVEHADAAIELGHMKWLLYESFAHRRLETSEMAVSRSVGKGSAPRAGQLAELYAQASSGLAPLGQTGGGTSTFGATGGVLVEPPAPAPDGALLGFEMSQGQLEMGGGNKPLKGIIEGLLQLTMALPSDVQGETYYREAESLFREAYEAWPSHARAFRNLAMVYVEKDRWVPAKALARSRLDDAPWDATAWMTLGLASHRLNDDKMAAQAFDSALALMTEPERNRFDRIERIMRGKDSTMLSKWNDLERQALVRRYWLSSDPLWSVDHTPPRVEFLSRVAFADIRWTLDERGIRGADTDRGEVYIRYGPPDIIIGLPPSPKDYIAELAQFWWYEKLGLLFAFNGAPTFGTMQFPSEDRQYARTMMNDAPVSWSNTAAMQIDPLPMRTARFRAAGDSVDVVLAARPPVDSILAGADIRGPVRFNYWMLNRRDEKVVHDSLSTSVESSSAFTHRVPAGWYLLRSEAAATGAKRAASTTQSLNAGNDSSTSFAMSGFGMSDLLIGTSLTSPAMPRGWRDFAAVPLAGSISRTVPLALVWESYGLDRADGQAKYELTIAFERERGAGGNVVAQIVDRLSAPVRTDRANNRVVFHFDRAVAYAPTLAEGFSIGLADTPRGTYKLTVTVADKVSGRTTTKSTLVEVRE